VRELLAPRYGSLEAADTFGGRALAVGACGGRALRAVLSRRELTVLELLPSLRSMDEIASDLTVSINTLKSRIRVHLQQARRQQPAMRCPGRHEHGLLLSSGSENQSAQARLISHREESGASTVDADRTGGRSGTDAVNDALRVPG